MTLNNLAVLRKSQGAPAEAAALYRRALAIFEQALGKRHPKTVVCRANHARLLRDTGRPRGRDRAGQSVRRRSSARLRG